MSTTTIPEAGTTTTWQIDPAHTEVGFEVKHMMFAKVRGRFEDVRGTITLDEEGESRTEVVIGAASVNTGQEQRDEHLRSGDFFDVEQFPELRFESRSVQRAGEGLVVVGDLTIRGVTLPVELDVTETGKGLDPWGNERVGFTATTAVDRRDFGLNWNQALEAGGILVGHEVKIVLEVQATRS